MVSEPSANQFVYDVENINRVDSANFDRDTNTLTIEASSGVTYDIISKIVKNAVDQRLILSGKESNGAYESGLRFVQYDEL